MTASWDELEKAVRPAAPNRFEEVCALVFSAGPGKELLALLRTKYFDAPMNGLADERALRLRINQQQFVRDLETACERGLTRKPK